MQVGQQVYGQGGESGSVRRAAQEDRLCLGMALVCCEPAIMARSGSVFAAKAWKAMLEVPEIKIASVGGWPWSADWFRWR